MTLFNEIYGAYFRIAAAVLGKETVTAGDISRIISEEGFRDSQLTLPEKLKPGRDSWGLLTDNGDGTFSRLTERPPVTAVTELQKRWLRAKLDDPRLGLFLTDEELDLLRERLGDTEPLYAPGDIRTFDRYSDGDDIASPEYRRNFRELLTAAKTGEITHICFRSGKGTDIKRYFLPLRIEYSPLNDKFRVYCRSVFDGRASGSTVINIGRITEIRRTGRLYEDNGDIEGYFRSLRCREPAVIQLSNERNAIERFMMEFSSFEKRAEYNMEKVSCRVELWYDRSDETELLIKLLSFGPVLEIIAPDSLRQQAAERVRRQYRLLNGE